MQTRTTIDQVQPARLIGIIASALVATILIVGFVIGSLGLGSESRAGQGLIKQPTPIVRSN